eukprot:8213643-Lingulodinium_polyedra.AAC.1
MDRDMTDAANPDTAGRGIMEALIWLSTPQHRRTALAERLVQLRIDRALISTLGHSFARQGIRTPNDLAGRMGGGAVPYGPLQPDTW